MKVGSRAYLTLFLSMLLTAAPVVAAEPLTTVRVASGLSRPLYVTHAPGDTSRLFIVEQVGRIRILDLTQDPPVLLAASFLDIQSSVRDIFSEQGLLGMAFHPDFDNNGFFYVNYTGNTGPQGDTYVVRFHVPTGTPNDADEGSAMTLLTIVQPFSNHNGGWIDFSPNDGYLYIGMGDGGSGGDPGHNAQTITGNLLGKMLRIDVDSDDFPANPDANYAIPLDNPFVGITGDDEIWAYGLRNPWRNAFDTATGDLYIADVGQGSWEEIDFQLATSTGGENYGWRCREGAHDSDVISSICQALQPGDYVDPIHEYSHAVGCSITGGEVYRGCAIPNLHGTYFFADHCSNQIWSFVYAGDPLAITEFVERTAELDPPGSQAITGISSFGHDAEGEMYICDLYGGEVFKIVPVNPAEPCSECGNDLREDPEQCDGTDDASCPGACNDLTCICDVPQVPGIGDDTCFDGIDPTGDACTTDDDCPAGAVCSSKSRYLSITPPAAAVAGGVPLGIRVEVTAMPGHPDRIGEVWWGAAPSAIPNSPLADLTGSLLECTNTPHLEAWSGGTTVHLYGLVVIPESTYAISMCEGVGGPCSSATITTTGKWGDLTAAFGGASQPNFADVSAAVDKFKDVVSAPSTARTDLMPELPNHVTNFADITAAVDGFKQFLYPFIPPACP